ncbi:hypothetical protein GA0115243_104729 [Streptomyces sp. ScaeMP-e83]|nr:hypothetical protein GA0115243_104729 [Streptomyces sp. ScaeMP-e83]
MRLAVSRSGLRCVCGLILLATRIPRPAPAVSVRCSPASVPGCLDLVAGATEHLGVVECPGAAPSHGDDVIDLQALAGAAGLTGEPSQNQGARSDSLLPVATACRVTGALSGPGFREWGRVLFAPAGASGTGRAPPDVANRGGSRHPITSDAVP